MEQVWIIRRIEERLRPHLLEEGFARDEAAATREMRWSKPGDDAPDGEQDRLAVRVDALDGPTGDWAIRGWAWSWTREAPVNLRLLSIEHRKDAAAPPSGWRVSSPKAVDRVVEELEQIVTGQLFGWFDEPVPLGGGDGRLANLDRESSRLLNDLVIPGEPS